MNKTLLFCFQQKFISSPKLMQQKRKLK